MTRVNQTVKKTPTKKQPAKVHKRNKNQRASAHQIKLEQLEKKINQCQQEVQRLKQPVVTLRLPSINIKLIGLTELENDRLNSILNSTAYPESPFVN